MTCKHEHNLMLTNNLIIIVLFNYYQIIKYSFDKVNFRDQSEISNQLNLVMNSIKCYFRKLVSNIQQNIYSDLAEYLERYNSDVEMLNRIIAIDETWLKYYDPKDYWTSRQYRLPEQPP